MKRFLLTTCLLAGLAGLTSAAKAHCDDDEDYGCSYPRYERHYSYGYEQPYYYRNYYAPRRVYYSEPEYRVVRHRSYCPPQPCYHRRSAFSFFFGF